MASHRSIPGSGSGSVSSSSSGIHHLNFPFGDTTYTKVFVGGLAWETNSEGLLRHFEQYGEILEAVVITDKTTGRSKGYGFVTFRDPGAARRACADPNLIIDGRRANCNLASLGRPAVSPFHARPRSANAYFGGVPATRGPYFGSHAYQQTIPYYYQQGFTYPSYGLRASKQAPSTYHCCSLKAHHSAEAEGPTIMQTASLSVLDLPWTWVHSSSSKILPQKKNFPAAGISKNLILSRCLPLPKTFYSRLLQQKSRKRGDEGSFRMFSAR